MDPKTFIDEIARPDNTTPGLIDGEFHALDRQHAEALRMALHQNIDTLFANLEIDDDGFVVSPLTINTKRDFMSLAVAGGRVAHIPTNMELTIRVEETLAQIVRRCAEARGE